MDNNRYLYIYYKSSYAFQYNQFIYIYIPPINGQLKYRDLRVNLTIICKKELQKKRDIF